jgi:CBS domain-containing protein
MFVQGLLYTTQERLVTISENAPLIEAARLLSNGSDLVIVCDSSGILAGVITKTDVISQMSRCDGAICTMTASLAMTRDAVLCRPDDALRDVWATMKKRSLKNIPVVDAESRPLGVLHARDILQVLLEESEDEEATLRDYVMGIGYLN